MHNGGWHRCSKFIPKKQSDNSGRSRTKESLQIFYKPKDMKHLLFSLNWGLAPAVTRYFNLKTLKRFGSLREVTTHSVINFVWGVFIGVRGGKPGGRKPPPGLINFSASFVFRASPSWSRILNDKKYFNTVKNYRATLFFRARASCSKILNDKNIYIQYSEFRAHSVFQGKRKVAQKSWMLKNIFNTVKNCRASSFQGKRKLLKNPEGWKNFLYRILSANSLGGDPCNLG